MSTTAGTSFSASDSVGHLSNIASGSGDVPRSYPLTVSSSSESDGSVSIPMASSFMDDNSVLNNSFMDDAFGYLDDMNMETLPEDISEETWSNYLWSGGAT